MRGPLASRSRLATWPSASRHSAVMMNKGPPVRTAEHQRERGAVLGQFDALQNFAAVGDAGYREPGVGPDRAFGVEADAVQMPWGAREKASTSTFALVAMVGMLAAHRLRRHSSPGNA